MPIENTTANRGYQLPAGANDLVSDVLRLIAALEAIDVDVQALFAGFASPNFSGTPTAPTAPLGTNTTQIATTAFVNASIDAIVGGAPGALDTLNELAAAIADDENYAAAMTAALALKADDAAVTAALAEKLARDGSIPWTGDQNADGNSITNLLNLNGRAPATFDSRPEAAVAVSDGGTIPATEGITVYMEGAICFLPDLTLLPVGFRVMVVTKTYSPLGPPVTISAQAGQTILGNRLANAAQTLKVPSYCLMWFRKRSNAEWVYGYEQVGQEIVLQSGYARDPVDWSTTSTTSVSLGSSIYIAPKSNNSVLRIFGNARISWSSSSILRWRWYDDSVYQVPVKDGFGNVFVAGSHAGMLEYSAEFSAAERRPSSGNWVIGLTGYTTSGTFTVLDNTYWWQEIEVLP